MFEKKFGVRVIHFRNEYYCVEYTYHYLIPCYKPLMVWYNYGYYDDLEGWTNKLFKYDQAIEFAKTLKTIDDILSLQKIETEKRDLFYEEKKQFHLKNPIKETKYF